MSRKITLEKFVSNILLDNSRMLNRLLRLYGFKELSIEDIANAFYSDGYIPSESDMESMILLDEESQGFKPWAYPNLSMLIDSSVIEKGRINLREDPEKFLKMVGRG